MIGCVLTHLPGLSRLLETRLTLAIVSSHKKSTPPSKPRQPAPNSRAIESQTTIRPTSIIGIRCRREGASRLKAVRPRPFSPTSP